MTKHLEFENVGPLPKDETVEFDLPEEGGLTVILGRNGVGKTTILHHIETLIGSGNGKVLKRDGAREARVSGLGRTLRIRKVTRTEGELEIEGAPPFDITTLHTPKFKTADTRDRYRIATLVKLSSVPASLDAFRELLEPDEFDRSVTPETRKKEDLVDMASGVKRDFEARSRHYAAQSENAETECKTKRDQNAGIDLTAPHDGTELSNAYEQAIEHRAKVVQRDDTAKTVKQNAAAARESLQQAEEAYDGPTLDEAELRYEEAQRETESAINEVQELERQLAAARARADAASDKQIAALEAKRAAKNHVETISQWRAAIDEAENVDQPTPEEVAVANSAVLEAKVAMETGQRVREALQREADAEELKKQAIAMAAKADQLRTAAHDVESILSEAVSAIPNCPLRIHFDKDGNARLVTPTPRDERTPFDELSDGEKYSIIIPMVMGPNRIITLPQPAYGELDPSNRRKMIELALQHKANIVTAQASDGDLRVEHFTEAGELIASSG